MKFIALHKGTFGTTRPTPTESIERLTKLGATVTGGDVEKDHVFVLEAPESFASLKDEEWVIEQEVQYQIPNPVSPIQ